MSAKLLAKHAILETFFHLPYLRYIVTSRYNYMFEPDQLIQLTKFVDETSNVPGCYFEIGCAAGDTTIFLNKYMARRGIEKPYVALDTFEGFRPKDVEYEVCNRGKSKYSYKEAFQLHRKKYLDAAIALEGLKNIYVIQADATRYNFAEPIAFCLLDIDLYLPIKTVLPIVYNVLSTGGVIVVDDCSKKNSRWDGALEAYLNFVAEMGLPAQILCDKLGVVRR